MGSVGTEGHVEDGRGFKSSSVHKTLPSESQEYILKLNVVNS